MKKENSGVVKALAMLVQIAITMLAPLLVCGWIGLWLNRQFDTSYGFLIMMLLGILTSFRNFFQLVRGFYEKDLKKENAQQEYFDNMKKERENARREKEESKQKE